MKNREPGYYRIKELKEDSFQIAEWDDCYWSLMSTLEIFNDEDFYEIDERPIPLDVLDRQKSEIKKFVTCLSLIASDSYFINAEAEILMEELLEKHTSNEHS